MKRWSLVCSVLAAGLLAPVGAFGCTGAERGAEPAEVAEAEVGEAPALPAIDPPLEPAAPEGEAGRVEPEGSADLPDVAAPAEEEATEPDPSDPAS